MTNEFRKVLGHLEGIIHGRRQIDPSPGFPSQPKLEGVIFPATPKGLVPDVVFGVVEFVALEKVGRFVAVALQEQILKKKSTKLHYSQS